MTTSALILMSSPDCFDAPDITFFFLFFFFTAGTGSKGLQLSREFRGEINLLLSDFQMPGMSGAELATVMTLDRPQLKVLLTSGFGGRKLVLNEGWHFLSKPSVAPQLRAPVGDSFSRMRNQSRPPAVRNSLCITPKKISRSASPKINPEAKTRQAAWPDAGPHSAPLQRGLPSISKLGCCRNRTDWKGF